MQVVCSLPWFAVVWGLDWNRFVDFYFLAYRALGDSGLGNPNLFRLDLFITTKLDPSPAKTFKSGNNFSWHHIWTTKYWTWILIANRSIRHSFLTYFSILSNGNLELHWGLPGHGNPPMPENRWWSESSTDPSRYFNMFWRLVSMLRKRFSSNSRRSIITSLSTFWSFLRYCPAFLEHGSLNSPSQRTEASRSPWLVDSAKLLIYLYTVVRSVFIVESSSLLVSLHLIAPHTSSKLFNERVADNQG